MPRPKPLATLIIVVSFLGGSNTMGQVIFGDRPPDREQEVRKVREKAKDLSLSAQETDRLAAGAEKFAVEQERVTRRFRPYVSAFGVLLTIAYGLALVFAMRAATFAPGAARQLSTVSLFVLPARVAFASVELASARALQPALRAWMEDTLAMASKRPSGMAEAQAEQIVATALGAASSWFLVAWQAFVTLAVLALFTYAWRYFQRPQVVAFYGTPPEP